MEYLQVEQGEIRQAEYAEPLGQGINYIRAEHLHKGLFQGCTVLILVAGGKLSPQNRLPVFNSPVFFREREPVFLPAKDRLFPEDDILVKGLGQFLAELIESDP